MLKFLENYDLMYLSMIGFSTILFTYVITKTVLEIRRFVKKEKAITKLEKKYDNLRQHRENLIVRRTPFSPSILGNKYFPC